MKIVAGLAVLAVFAVSGASSAPAALPGANGPIVFASARPIPGQPAGAEIYSKA